MTLQAVRKTILHKPEKSRKTIIIASLLLTFVMALIYLYRPVFFGFLDNKFYDTLLRAAPKGAVTGSGLPVIVEIDEKSLSKYGQWPWSRYRIALLIDKLTEMGASTVGFDMVLAEPDRTSLAVIQKDIYRDLRIDVPMDRVPKALMDHDKTLSNTLARGPFVLGYKFIFTENQLPAADCLLHPLNVAVVRDAGMPPVLGRFLFRSRDAVCNLRSLAENVTSSGFFNVTPDADGVLRRVPLLIEYKERLYPSLALATLIQSQGIKQVFLKEAQGGIEYLRLDNTVIPLDGKGNMLIRYQGKGKTFNYISAADLLEGHVSKKQIEGRIVFLWASAAGLADLHSTPVDAIFPGVEVHATIIDNILKKDFFSRPSWIPGLELMLVIGAGLFSTLLLTWTGALWSLFFLSIGSLGLWQCSLWALHCKGIFFSPLVPLIALGSNFIFVTLLKYWREEQGVKARAKELMLTQDFTIRCLASLTECRDSETGGHILRTQRYVSAVCRQMATHPRFRDALDSETVEHLFKSSPLHDIGKVGVPDHILLKPGKLTPEEFEEMKKHTTYGRDAIQRAEEKFGGGTSSEFLRLAKEIAYTHHEKWDGTGYPESLKGENIPLSGRIMALADVYDALICERVYKPPFTHEEAVALIVQLKGLLFDPDVVAAFLEVEKEFRQISIDLADSEEHNEVFTDHPILNQ
ncbi:MAG: metal-dependent phosphohydrolase [Syntrophus sp. (in: bacteria)]|nr:metal-dependent phosphohydrolase [Syntrophus sp. (in: bacteria)]